MNYHRATLTLPKGAIIVASIHWHQFADSKPANRWFSRDVTLDDRDEYNINKYDKTFYLLNNRGELVVVRRGDNIEGQHIIAHGFNLNEEFILNSGGKKVSYGLHPIPSPTSLRHSVLH